jgi:hypothetical protein
LCAISLIERPIRRYSATSTRRNSVEYGFWKSDPRGEAEILLARSDRVDSPAFGSAEDALLDIERTAPGVKSGGRRTSSRSVGGNGSSRSRPAGALDASTSDTNAAAPKVGEAIAAVRAEEGGRLVPSRCSTADGTMRPSKPEAIDP